MDRMLNRLSAVAVNTGISRRGMYHDGGGLYLQVRAGGAKSWIFRFMLDGRAREMGFRACKLEATFSGPYVHQGLVGPDERITEVVAAVRGEVIGLALRPQLAGKPGLVVKRHVRLRERLGQGAIGAEHLEGNAADGAALVAKTAHTAAAVANFRMLRLLLDPDTH